MKKIFQAKFRSEIFLTMMFGAVVLASQSPSGSHHSDVNLSFERENNILLQPIVIPNLTGFSEDFFTSKSQLNSRDDKKLPEVFREKAFDVVDRNKESSQDSEVRIPLTKEISKSKENVSKFSSRYSSKPEVYETIIQDTKEGINTRGIKEKDETKEEEEESKKIAEGSEVPSLLEIAENESDILPENTIYPGNTENALFLEREKDEQEETSDDDDHTHTQETGRGSETVATSSEANSELRITSSVDPWTNRDSDEKEQENREAVQHDTIATKEHEEDERRRADDHGDPKNYHSIQTPLHKIKFMGSHDFKDDSESSRMRTRPINPIEQDRVKYEWPYFKTQVKAEAENDNEILNNGNESHDKEEEEDLEKWKNDKIRVNSELDRAVAKDEARFGPASNHNQKYNVIREKTRHLKNQKALIAEEEKDHERPLFKILSHNSENQPELNFGDKMVGKTNKQEKERLIPRLTPTERASKLNNLKSTNFNISEELEPEFQGLKFFSSSIFNKNIQQKPPKSKEHSTELSKNIFIQELENKEMIDQKNLLERKSKELKEDMKITSESFNHLEDSDEMYNQILANIQSVFGLRTQPLKSSLGRKDNKDPELEQEENKSLTWSTTFLRRTKAGYKGAESSPIKETERKV